MHTYVALCSFLLIASHIVSNTTLGSKDMVLSLISVVYLVFDFGKVKLDVCYFEIFYDQKKKKESTFNAVDTGDPCLIPGSGIFSGEGNDNPLQCSCLENPMGRGAWWATGPWGHTESQTRLSDQAHMTILLNTLMKLLSRVSDLV